LRVWQYARGDDVGKECPCCILLPLRKGQIVSGAPVHVESTAATVVRHVSDDGDVLILPIQSNPPGQLQMGLELPVDVKKMSDFRQRLRRT